MRTFTIESSNIDIKGGRYKSLTPLSCAQKAASRLFKEAKNKRKIIFTIRETTKGNNKNIYNFTASRVRNGEIIINNHNKIQNKRKIKGGTYEIYEELDFNIEKQIFIVHIGDYCFRVYHKVNKYDTERLIVNILCIKYVDTFRDINLYEKFSVYQSRSELGCWRLCLKTQKNRTQYVKGDKGHDYIQQTFIHPLLQNFINKCIPHLHYNETEPLTHCANTAERENELLSHIDDNNRVVIESPFNEYNLTTKCGYKDDSIRENLNAFSKKLEKEFEIVGNAESIGQNEIKNDLDEYTIHLKRVKLSRKKRETEQVSKKEISEFVLYYNIFVVTKFYNKPMQEQIVFNIPSFLTTIDGNKITKFGTFEKYVVSGNYICKLFEYDIQCSRKFDSEKRCFGTYYRLIGDIYNNLFPFNTLHEDFLPKENIIDTS